MAGTDLYAGGSFTTAGGKVSAYVAKALLVNLVAHDAAYTRAAGSPLTIPIADVAWEVNGNPVTVQSLGSSVQGATLSYDSYNIYYLPANDSNDSFTYTVSNGTGTASGTITVTVTVPPNTVPVATPGLYSVLEDHSLAGNVITDDTGNGVDSDADHDPLTAHVDTAPAYAQSFSLNAEGSFAYSPQAEFNGADAFTYHVNDGQADSPVVTVAITVTPVNDAPGFTKGADVTTLEDSGPQSVSGWATFIYAGPVDEAGQTLTFAATADQPALFAAGPSIAADGTLTYTPAPNASGVATVTVTLKDDGGTANGGMDISAPETYTITVTPVNDAPSFVKGVDQTVLEDAGPQSVSGWASAISAGPADEAGQTLMFAVTTDIPTLFAAGPSVTGDGTLTYTPAPNANGVATVTLTLKDDGGPANGGIDTSTPQTITITVTAVNDAPSFAIGPDQTVNADAGAQVVAGWATAIR